MSSYANATEASTQHAHNTLSADLEVMITKFVNEMELEMKDKAAVIWQLLEEDTLQAQASMNEMRGISSKIQLGCNDISRTITTARQLIPEKDCEILISKFAYKMQLLRIHLRSEVTSLDIAFRMLPVKSTDSQTRPEATLDKFGV